MDRGEMRRLQRLRRKYRTARDREAALKRETAGLRKRAAALADGYVVETCPFCETQDVFLWDTGRQGLMFYCPACGARVMLCDYCDRKETDCDYDYGADTCCMMQKRR